MYLLFTCIVRKFQVNAGTLAYNKVRLFLQESHFMTRLTVEGKTVFQAAALFRLRFCESLKNKVVSDHGAICLLLCTWSFRSDYCVRTVIYIWRDAFREKWKVLTKQNVQVTSNRLCFFSLIRVRQEDERQLVSGTLCNVVRRVRSQSYSTAQRTDFRHSTWTRLQEVLEGHRVIGYRQL